MRRLCVVALLVFAGAAHASQNWPAVASDDVDSLVVWTENATLFARRVNAAGHPLNLPVALGQSSAPAALPFGYYPFGASAVAFGRSAYLVVWPLGKDVVALRLDLFGNPLDAAPITVRKKSSISEQPIAWNGKAFRGRMRSDGDVRSIGLLELGPAQIRDAPALAPGIFITSGINLQIHTSADFAKRARRRAAGH